ncbi:hypothetical protein, partial [uncultured Microscilla sp.]|uniref:hypothetical protein n=1 Tax=uncultured Microscilla sp. TaxID=432653 RepID=UPI0026256913
KTSGESVSYFIDRKPYPAKNAYFRFWLFECKHDKQTNNDHLYAGGSSGSTSDTHKRGDRNLLDLAFPNTPFKPCLIGIFP